MRLSPGSPAPDFQVQDLQGTSHSLQDYRGTPLLLQFFRFSGCPMCDLRIHDFAREYPALEARGLRALAFFHSSPERLRRHFAGWKLPYPVVADPGQTVYRAYGVERSLIRTAFSGLKPSFYLDWMRSMRHGFWGGMDLKMTTMPADFLVGADGALRLVHYGGDIGDHLPAAQLSRALEARAGQAPSPHSQEGGMAERGTALPAVLTELRGRMASVAGLEVADAPEGSDPERPERVEALLRVPGGPTVKLVLGEEGALLRVFDAPGEGAGRPPRVQRVALDLRSGFVYSGLRLASAAALVDAVLEDMRRAATA